MGITTKQICKKPTIEDYRQEKLAESKRFAFRQLKEKNEKRELQRLQVSNSIRAVALDVREADYEDMGKYALLENKYAEEAIAMGFVSIVNEERVFALRMTREQALAEPTPYTPPVGAPIKTPAQIIASCETEVVTINAPKVSMKYDPARDKALRIKLDAIYGYA